MDQRIRFGGYLCRFRLRTVSIKRKQKGRTRGRYEGNYVYLELAWMQPHPRIPGRMTRMKRELYIGKERVKDGAPARDVELLEQGGKTEGYVRHVNAWDGFSEEEQPRFRAHNGRSANRKKG